MSETLERIIPEELDGNLTYASHINRYMWASRLVKGKEVIDAACGVGYGTNIISCSDAKSVVGVDIAKKAINHAKKAYKRDNLHFMEGDVTKLRLPDSSLDVFISFETIEHISKPDKIVSEAKRLLKNDGIFIVSVPNEKIWQNFENEYHLENYDLEKFKNILKDHFTNMEFYGQQFFTSSTIISRIQGEKIENLKVNFPNSDIRVDNAPYIIAVCSDVKLPSIGTDDIYLGNDSIVDCWRYSLELNNIIASMKEEDKRKTETLNRYRNFLPIKIVGKVKNIFRKSKYKK
jgi:ubiquinone/menaquinone biosynthesis C-methylase UbiE